MTTLATHPAELGECAKAIRQFHDINARNQAGRTRRAVVLGILLTVLGGAALTDRASAQSHDWIVVPVTTGEDPVWLNPLVATLNQGLTERRVGAWPSDRAATRLEQKGSAPSTKIADADIDAWVARSHDGVRHLARGNYTTAMQELKKAQVLSRRASDELNREQALAQNVLDTCLYIVRALLETENRAGAEEQVRECVRLVPRAEPNPHMHKRNVISLYKQAVSPGPEQTGSLNIESGPSGCDVRINGWRFGKTPFEITNLYPGTYRVQVECDPKRRGRVHQVVVRPGQMKLLVDVQFDRAVRTAPMPMLSYPERPSYRALIGDAQEIARLLPAGAIVLAMMPNADSMELRVVSGTERRRGLARITTATTGPSTTDVSTAVDALINGECKDFTEPRPVDIDCKTGRVRSPVQADVQPPPTSNDSPRWVSPGGYLPSGR